MSLHTCSVISAALKVIKELPEENRACILAASWVYQLNPLTHNPGHPSKSGGYNIHVIFISGFEQRNIKIQTRFTVVYYGLIQTIG